MKNPPKKPASRRIAIVTFASAFNYGAILQALGLQSTLARLGVKADLVDYSNPHIAWVYAPVKRSGLFFGGFGASLVHIWNAILAAARNSRFRRFVARHLHLTRRRFYLSDDLNVLNDRYDAFIAGSDQVFGLRCTNFDTAYFLSFVADPAKKFSYAASFGFDQVPAPYRKVYAALLSDFASLSVREESGRAILHSLLGPGVPVQVHVDPTLLLSPDDWRAVAATSRRRLPRRYILVYNVQPPERLFEEALRLSDRLRIPVLYLGFEPFWVQRVFRRRVHLRYVAGPEDFLAAFANADYVLTNSFHGTVFSCLFRRRFAVELENKRMFNYRVQALLAQFNLADRAFSSADLLETLEKPVDWDAFERLRAAECARSESYLLSIAKGPAPAAPAT